MTIPTLTRRAIVPLAIFAAVAGCNRMVWGTSHSYLAWAFGHPSVMFDSGLGDYFYMYKLSERTSARIAREGLAFEGFHTRPRSRSGLHDFARGMRWFETPMFTTPDGAADRQVQPDAARFLGKWSALQLGYAIGTNGHHLSPRAQTAYDTLRDALEMPGSYFGFDDTSEAFGIVAPRQRLMLLTRGEI